MAKHNALTDARPAILPLPRLKPLSVLTKLRSKLRLHAPKLAKPVNTIPPIVGQSGRLSPLGTVDVEIKRPLIPSRLSVKRRFRVLLTRRTRTITLTRPQQLS